MQVKIISVGEKEKYSTRKNKNKKQKQKQKNESGGQWESVHELWI